MLIFWSFTRPGVEFRETLNEMISYQHDADYRHAGQRPTPRSLRTLSSQKARQMLWRKRRAVGRPVHCKDGLCSTATPSGAITAASDFTHHDLVNYERPVSLCSVVPPSDKIRLRCRIRLMFTMVVNRLTGTGMGVR